MTPSGLKRFKLSALQIDHYPPFFRDGSWAAVRHHKHNLPQHLGKLTIRVAINRSAEAHHDAANLAK